MQIPISQNSIDTIKGIINLGIELLTSNPLYLIGITTVIVLILLRWYWKTTQIKIIYFVRHGETILNAKRIRQGREGGLSEKGIEQTKFLVERVKHIPIQTIIASPFERAQQTASIVAESLHKPVELNELLSERRNPHEVIGKSYDDPEVIRIIDLIDKGFHDNKFRYSDEENFEDLKERAKKLLSYLERRKEKRILVVTHGIFLKMVVSYMLFRERLNAPAYVKFSFLNDSSNASITVVQYNPYHRGDPAKGWKVIVWDDYGRIETAEDNIKTNNEQTLSI